MQPHPLGLEGRQVEHHTEEGAGPHRRPLPYSAVQQHLKEQVAGEAGQQGRQAGSYPPVKEPQLQSGNSPHLEPVQEHPQGGGGHHPHPVAADPHTGESQ